MCLTAKPDLHQTLIDQLKRKGTLSNPQIEAAFRAIPRHLFLPHLSKEEVYQDRAITTKQADNLHLSSSSQPTMMAIMLEQLNLSAGQRVLEIGAGTGYNAALIAYLVGETGQVVTLDIDQDLVDGAKAHLAAIGYERVQVICADGGYGFAQAGPYDRIILTVGADDITPAWLEQLKPGGLLLLPLAIKDVQVSVVFRRVTDHLESLSASGCGFIRMRGDFADPHHNLQRTPLDPDQRMLLLANDLGSDQTQRLYQALFGPSQDWPTGVHLTLQEIQRYDSLGFWCQLQAEKTCMLVEPTDTPPTADETTAESAFRRSEIPYLIGQKGQQRRTMGLLDDDSLVLLANPRYQEPPPEQTPFELHLRSFGPNQALAQQFLAHLQAWDQAGRPSLDNVRLRVYPRWQPYQAQAGEFVLPKRWTQIVVDWP